MNISNSLDISYNYSDDNFSSYRITIEGNDFINKYVNGLKNRNNNIIYSLLLSKIINKNENIKIIEKIKDIKMLKI